LDTFLLGATPASRSSEDESRDIPLIEASALANGASAKIQCREALLQFFASFPLWEIFSSDLFGTALAFHRSWENKRRNGFTLAH
jgi:hypothetical protein